MDGAGESTGNDWERLKEVFFKMRTDLDVMILETPRVMLPRGPGIDEDLRDEMVDETIAGTMAEMKRRGKLGVIYFYEQDVDHAVSTGDLELSCMVTGHKKLGHRLVKRFFNMNTVFALRYAEKRALMDRIVNYLRGQRFEVSWSGNHADSIIVHGKWA